MDRHWMCMAMCIYDFGTWYRLPLRVATGNPFHCSVIPRDGTPLTSLQPHSYVFV